MWITFEQKKYLNGNTITARLYLIEVFYLRKKIYGCKIVLSWTDCKSKLDQQCK